MRTFGVLAGETGVAPTHETFTVLADETAPAHDTCTVLADEACRRDVELLNLVLSLGFPGGARRAEAVVDGLQRFFDPQPAICIHDVAYLCVDDLVGCDDDENGITRNMALMLWKAVGGSKATKSRKRKAREG